MAILRSGLVQNAFKTSMDLLHYFRSAKFALAQSWFSPHRHRKFKHFLATNAQIMRILFLQQNNIVNTILHHRQRGTKFSLKLILFVNRDCMRCRRDTACRVRAVRAFQSPSTTALLVPLAQEGESFSMYAFLGRHNNERFHCV